MKTNNINNTLKFLPQKHISFKAKIVYVDEYSFANLLIKMPDSFEVGKRWIIEESAVKRASAFTLGAYNCVIGSIFNPKIKKVNMFHISPINLTERGMLKIKNRIFEQVKILKGDSKVKLQGFITGGNSDSIAAPINEKRLLPAIEEIFKDISENSGMDYSVIAGRTHGYNGVSVVSNALENTHYVHTFRDLDFNFKRTVTGMDNISNHYDITKISPKDKLYFS